MLASRDNRIAVVERLIDMGVNVNEQADVSRSIVIWIAKLFVFLFTSKTTRYQQMLMLYK